MTDTNENVDYQATRATLVATVDANKLTLEASKAALRDFDETAKKAGVTVEASPRRSTRRSNGIPSIEDALVTILRENGNEPMTAQQVYDALVKRTEWTYKSGDLGAYVRYTLSGRKEIFDRPHVTVAGKVERRGWYQVNAGYRLKDGTTVTSKVPTTVVAKPAPQTTADEILNTEFTLGSNNNPFKTQTQENV